VNQVALAADGKGLSSTDPSQHRIRPDSGTPVER
jgi:hypothetical protein